MKNGSLQYLNLYLCLRIKFLLIFYDLQSYVLSFLVIEGFEHSSERSTSKGWNYLVFVSYCISNRYLRVTFGVSKILETYYSPVSSVVNIKVFALFSLEMSQLFVKTFFRPLKLDRSFRFNSFFAIPNLFETLIEIVILLRWKFFADSSTPDDNFVDTVLFFSRMTGWNRNLNRK